MALTVITGLANVGKSAHIKAHLIRAYRENLRALLLLPSAPDVARTVAEVSHDMPIGVTVKTFDAHLDGLWRTLGDGRRIVSTHQRWAILAELVRQCEKSADVLPRSFAGYTRILAHLAGRVSEKEWENFPYIEFDGALLPGTPEEGRALVGELLFQDAMNYRQYLVQKGLIERAEAHRLVIPELGEGTGFPVIAIHRFTGFTTVQESFIERAALFADTLVSLTYDPAVPATAAASSTVKRLGSWGQTRVVAAEVGYSVSPELVRIERHLGNVGDGSVSAEGAVILSEAWGEGAEAARITREVQDALAAGVEGHRIAVVFRDAMQWRRSLYAELEEANILHDWDVQVPISQISLGRAVLGILGLSSVTPDHNSVMDLLRSPYSPATDRTMDELDSRIRRSGSVSWSRLYAWCSEIDREAESFLRQARGVARMAMGAGAGNAWHHLTMGMFARARPAGPGQDIDTLADAAVVRAVKETLEGLRDLVGEPLSATDLAAILRERAVTLASCERTGHVQVMSAERVRGRRFECVIVGGLTEGEFPRHIGKSALSSPGIRQTFEARGIDVSERAGTEDERLLFYQVVTRASRRLVLSWQSHDESGRPRRPSLFLEEVLDLYRNPETGEYFAGRPPHQVLGMDSTGISVEGPQTRRRLYRTLAACCQGCLPEDGRDQTAVLLEQAELSPEEVPGIIKRLEQAARRATLPSPQLGDRAREELGARAVFSVSEIETYLQCPYRWYVERIIRPRDLDAKLDAAAVGRAAHEIMRRFYGEFEKVFGLTCITADTLVKAREIHRDVAASVQAACLSGSIAEEAELRAAVLGTARIIEADVTILPGMRPQYREWSFGMDGADQPELIDDFALAGRVDRIDTDGKNLVITDYKLGAVTSRRGRKAFRDEGLVQLPLYALVASKRLGLEAKGGIYRSIKRGGPRGFIDEAVASDDFVKTDCVGADEITAILAEAVVRAQEAVSGIRAGVINPDPRGGVCPSYCGARQFCKKWRPGRD